MTDGDASRDAATPAVARLEPVKRRRWPRRLWRASLVVVVLGALYVGVTFAQVVAVGHRDDARGSDVRPAEAILVAGAAQYNGRPSPVLEARLRHALELYERKIAPVIVVTGGRQPGDQYNEGEAGYLWLTDHGVPDADVLVEVHGRTTWQEMQASAGFLHERGIHDVILVSDDYHGLRLLAIAEELGLQARLSPSPLHVEGMDRLRHQLRETVAVSIGRITGFRRLDRR